ncbi:MAG: hypothetical protein ABI651_05705 [Verrucomicrobiota bacterium]
MLLGELDECAKILALAHPGLGEATGAHILENVSGNPKDLLRFLQMVSNRLRGEWCWEGGSKDNDLTREGLAALRALPKEPDRILELLLDDGRIKEPAIIEALSLSSHQGFQFLHELTEAVARELGPPAHRRDSALLQRAHHPHNLVAPLPQTRVPASEFREALVCELLRSQQPKASPQRVSDALRSVLLRRMTGREKNSVADPANN